MDDGTGASFGQHEYMNIDVSSPVIIHGIIALTHFTNFKNNFERCVIYWVSKC